MVKIILILGLGLSCFANNIKEEVGSIEYIKKEFTYEKLGNKEHYVNNPPKNGDKDFVAKVEENKVDGYVYNETTNKWEYKLSTNVGGFGNDTKVEVANKEILYHEFNTDINKLEVKSYFQEKVICNEAPSSLEGKNVFVVNQNNKLGELIYVANPDDGIFGDDEIFGIYDVISSLFLKANDICTSNIKYYHSIISIIDFNQNLDRWDTENAISMSSLFYNLQDFNNGCSFGDTSCPLKWNTRNVKDMRYMFSGATSFNQDISNWNTSKVDYFSNFDLGAGSWQNEYKPIFP